MTGQAAIQITDIIGNRGKYQYLAILVSFYVNALMGTVHVFVELLAPEVDIFWDWEANSSNKTIFKSTKCKMDELIKYNGTSPLARSSSKLIYHTPYLKHSLTEELQLVCERSWLISFANCIQMTGCLFGSIIFGLLAERYGRRKVTVGLLFISVAANVVILFHKHIVVFLIACFAYGGTVIPTYQTSFIPIVEMIPVSKRAVYGSITRFGAIFGQTLIAGAAWILEDWFFIQLTQTVFSVTCFLLSWYTLESPLWLAVRGHYEEARMNAMSIIDRNGMDKNELEPRVDQWLHSMKSQRETEGASEKGKIGDLFGSMKIAKYTVALSFVMLSILFIYFGLVMNVESFGSNLYEDLTISNGFALGSGILTTLFLTKCSLRLLTIITMTFLGVTNIIYTLVYEYALARTILSVLARVFVCTPYITIYIYMTEIYPTSVRVVGSGFSSMVSRIPSALSPFTKELSEKTEPYVPFIVFAVMSIASAVVLKFLPETKGKPISQTVREMNQ